MVRDFFTQNMREAYREWKQDETSMCISGAEEYLVSRTAEINEMMTCLAEYNYCIDVDVHRIDGSNVDLNIYGIFAITEKQ